MENRCLRCGLRLTGIQTYCPACGFELSHRSDTKNPRTTERTKSNTNTLWPENNYPFPSAQIDPPNNPSSTKVDSAFNFGDLIGLRKISGTVIAIEQPYMVKPETNLPKLLLKICLCILFLPIIIGVVIGLFIASKMFSLFFSSNDGRSGFLSTTASQTVSFFLTGKLFGPKDMVPVRDIRLMDKSRVEYLVRIKGDLYAGNVNVGDDIEVEGFDRRGTIVFYRGKNIRTRSEIIVKKQ